MAIKLYEITHSESHGSVYLVRAENPESARDKLLSKYDFENPEEFALSEVQFDDDVVELGPGDR